MKFSAFLFPVLLLLTPHATTCSVLNGNETDRMALLDFKLSCSDPRGSLASWNASLQFCSWKGVLCSQKHPQRIMQLDLTDQDLIGHISPSLGNLTYLRVLRLSNNSFTGEIPTSFGQLRRLKVISMSNNSLQGSIPEELYNCFNLQIVSLYSNHLVGRIPSGIGSLTKLIILNLAANNLTGSIPHSIGNMTALSVISLSENYIQGSIPEELGMLTRLSTLVLGVNSLSGRIPVTLFNMSSLTMLGLELNHLDKVVLPSYFGSHLPNLLHLGLDSNNFEGPIPASLANASGLTDIGMSYNNFFGKVPSSLGKLHDLVFLNLESNRLETSERESWEFIDSLANCSKLQTIALSINNLGGTLPNSIGNLSSELQILYLGTNNLYGMLPSSITSLRSLIALSLENNHYNGAIPERIGNLRHLQENKIDGILPPSLGNMKSLLRLNISNNNLEGSVPGLMLLNQMDLSYNHLVGEVPMKGVFLNASALVLEGNLGLCGGISKLHLPACHVAPSDYRHRRRSLRIKIIAIVAITVISLLVITVVVTFLLRRNKLKEASTTLPSFNTKFFMVTYKDLAEATDRFSEHNLIGRGRYGSVYRARLQEESDFVAVKIFNMEIRGANRSFVAECDALRSLRHRNLVPILTACSSIDSEGNDFKALVYEFMPNGSLDSLLYPKEDGTHTPCYLTLDQRLTIALDIANALEYLHHNSQRPIVHYDLKPANILLTSDMTARISDFGLARFFDDVSTASTAAVKGTIGYIAPEYASGGQVVMASSDVYSFGIILLEMFTGRRPTDEMFRDGLSIVSFVESNLPDHIPEVVDAWLKEEIDDFGDRNNESMMTVLDCVQSALRIGLSCSRGQPNERMNMREVVQKLQAVRDSYV